MRNQFNDNDCSCTNYPVHCSCDSLDRVQSIVRLSEEYAKNFFAIIRQVSGNFKNVSYKGNHEVVVIVDNNDDIEDDLNDMIDKKLIKDIVSDASYNESWFFDSEYVYCDKFFLASRKILAVKFLLLLQKLHCNNNNQSSRNVEEMHSKLKAIIHEIFLIHDSDISYDHTLGIYKNSKRQLAYELYDFIKNEIGDEFESLEIKKLIKHIRAIESTLYRISYDHCGYDDFYEFDEFHDEWQLIEETLDTFFYILEKKGLNKTRFEELLSMIFKPNKLVAAYPSYGMYIFSRDNDREICGMKRIILVINNADIPFLTLGK